MASDAPACAGERAIQALYDDLIEPLLDELTALPERERVALRALLYQLAAKWSTEEGPTLN